MAERLDIELQRNEDWDATLIFEWPDTGTRIDLTGCSISMQVRERLDDTANAPIATGTCTITDAVHGTVDVVLIASSGPLHSYGPALQTVNLAHDIRITDTDSVERVVFSGRLILSRGVTQ